MASRRALLLHKTEWERINRNVQKNYKHSNEDYIKSLNEQSQMWIKSWPDSVQGHVCLIEKQKQIQREKNLAFVKDYISQTIINKDKCRESIKQARKLLFEDSCYGRQLLSALLESKAIEERNAQIKFKKEIKDTEKHREDAQPLCNSIESVKEMEKKETIIKFKQKENNLRTAEINKFIVKKQKEDKTKEDIENFQVMRDAIYNEKIKAAEVMEKEKRKQNFKNDLKDYIMERERIKEKRRKEEVETLKKIEKIREDQERLHSKIKAVNKKIIKEKHNDRSASVYNQLKLLKEEEQSRYDKFIESGLRRHSLDAEQLIQPKLKGKKNYKKFEYFLKTDKLMKCDITSNLLDKCLCDRQCIISKSCKDRRHIKTYIPNTDQTFVVRNTLVEEYRKRQKKPSDWSGLNAAHAQFASHATAIIEECQYKHMAKKVVNEYRRTNCLDDKTLLIPNC